MHQDQALRQAAGQAFYNTSKFTLRDLKARTSQQQLKADFEAYLDGFSPNVQDILDHFEFRNQISRLSKAAAHGKQVAHPPIRPGDQRGDLCHLQGGPAAQGRRRRRGQHRRRAGALDALQ